MTSFDIRKWSSRTALSWLLLVSLVGVPAGCGGGDPVEPAVPITDPKLLFTSLTLTSRAILMSTVAPYDTLQLHAVPRDAQGNSMPGLPLATFTSSDTTKVRVTADGLLVAAGQGGGVTLIASLTVGPVTHADTAIIDVTGLADPAKLAGLSIHPIPPDSAIWPWVTGCPGCVNLLDVIFFATGLNPHVFHTLDARVVDMLGNDVSADLRVEYKSLDPLVAVFSEGNYSGGVTTLKPGVARMVAQTTAYGVTVADTLALTIAWPLVQHLVLRKQAVGGPAFQSQYTFVRQTDIRIQPHGFVFWMNSVLGSGTIDIVFDDPAAATLPPTAACDLYMSFLQSPNSPCGTGNVSIPTPEPADTSLYALEVAGYMTAQARQFPGAGVFPYHSTRLGISGRVIVEANPER